MTAEEFMGICIRNLINDNISVCFSKRKYKSKYAYNFFCTDAKNPELQINFFKNDFEVQFPIFVHEYCHYLQFKDDLSKWKSYDKYSISFDAYINGDKKKITRNTIAKIQELESDCDQRVLKLIKEYDLPINVVDYIKESNLYIYSYRYIVKYRKFFVSYEQDLLDLMPEYLMSADDFAQEIPTFEDLYLKHLGGKLSK